MLFHFLKGEGDCTKFKVEQCVSYRESENHFLKKYKSFKALGQEKNSVRNVAKAKKKVILS